MNEANNGMSIEGANGKILFWMEFQQQEDFADSSLRKREMSKTRQRFYALLLHNE
jgi:hypothetical protein